MSRTQTRLPLRPSTNMSHTTYVKHTGYQVNIIHHESHVSSNTNKQYSTIHMPMSYSTPKPCGWQRDPTRNPHQLRGWVGGKLSDSVAFRSWSKSASSIGVRTACSNTDAGPAVPAVATLLRCTDGIPSAHVRNRRNPFRPLSLAQSNESEPVYRPIGLRHDRLPVRRIFGLRGLPPSAPT